jgi:hypothetical protein
MVSYKDHLGAFKWNTAKGDHLRSPKSGRKSFKYIPLYFLYWFTIIKVTASLRRFVDELPYWEHRVIYIQRQAKNLEKINFDLIIASNSKSSSTIKKFSVF